MTIHDISVPISNRTPVYTGDPAVEITRAADIEQGDELTLSRIVMGAHTGTHLDAPLHFVRGGATVDQLDLNVLIGPALVVELPNVDCAITAADLEAAHLPGDAERILFKTSNTLLWDKPGFQTDFIAFRADGAQWLVEHGVRLVAIDYLSAEVYGAAQFQAHRILLGAGIIIVEGVMLKDIKPGSYQLICLPLKLGGAEGAPARAVLIDASIIDGSKD